MRRLLPLILMLLVFAEDARASCAPPDPRGHMKYIDAAFDGRFVSQRTGASSWERWLTFRVDRVFKGQLGETVEIYERGMSSVSFGTFEPGQRVGLTMNFADGAWQSNTCQHYDPEELADAVEPIPRPPGRGRAAFLVSGSFGDTSMALLDHRGRALAYGSGGGQVESVCPGGRRFVVAGHKALLVRRTRDLRLVRRIRLGFTQRAHCLRDAIVRATSSGLFRGGRRIWRGKWAGMAFHGHVAYVTRGHAILSVDLRSGRERRVADLPLTPQHEELRVLKVSPDGRRLAVLAPNWAVQAGEAASRVAMVDVTARPPLVRTAELPEGGAYWGVAWADRDRFAVTAHHHYRSTQAKQPARFYDARLRQVGEIPGWTALPLVGGNGAVMGTVGHRFERATPAGASELSRLPSSWVSSVHRLPGVAVRGSRRVPKY